MADAVIPGGGEMEPEQQQQQQRTEETSAGLLEAESNRAGAAKDTTQNGGRSESSSTEEALLVAAVAAVDKVPPNLSITSSSQRRSSILTANEQQQQQPPSAVSGGPPPLPKPPEDLPVRRNFQIPRKSREKKALFQPIAVGSREFEDVVKILHSSYLEPSSVSNFTYRKSSLVHSELLEKEFTEKRRELKSDGRLEKELSEAYAFLLADRSQIQSICEKGLQVGHSKITTLGSPAMGVYVSRYADLLQPNPLENGASGDVIVFKIIKGKMKSMYDNIGMKAMESTAKSALDPTPKHECHVSKNANKVTSLLAYRAYELTQYYFYEYVFDEIRRRPRHVCPYAVVSFTYKDEMVQVPKFLPPSRSNSFNTDRSTEKSSYTLWRGQLWNKGKLLCHISLKSAIRPFLPCKLPEKLEVEKVLSIDQLKKKMPPALFYKETYLEAKEVLKNGMYCSLYEVVEMSRSGIHLESLLQKLEKEKLVLVKTLQDRGFLFLLSPWQIISPYDHHTGRPPVLHALFLFPEPRGVMRLAQRSVPVGTQQNSTTENQEIIPELTKFLKSLHFALFQSRKDTTAELNVVVEKYINEYWRRGGSVPGNYREFVLCEYGPWLDEKKFLYPAPKNKSHIDSFLHNYIFGCEAYQLPVSRAKELMEGNWKPQQFSPVSDYEATADAFDFTTAEDGRPCAQYEAIADMHELSDYGDYDRNQLKKLIGLIQCRKKDVGGASDNEDPRNKSSLKRKLEKESEHLWKYLKMSESSENSCHDEGGRTSDLPRSVFSINTALGGHDTDLRQQDVSNPAVTDIHGVIKLLLETLASAGHLDLSLAQSLYQALGLSTDEIEEDMRQKYEYESIPAQDKDDHELPNTAQVENVNYKDQPSPTILEPEAACLPYPVDVGLQLPASEVGLEHTLRLKEASTRSVRSIEDYSPCPSMPMERIYRRQRSNSTKIGEVGMHWKLIPITGLKSPEETLVHLPPKDAFPNDPRVINRQRSSDYQFPYSPFSDTQRGTAEDGLYTRQAEKLEDQCGLANNPFTTKHSISAIIETTLLEEYNLFARKVQEILHEKNIAYVSGVSTPAFSAQERMMRLSEYICLQASEISVQEYIETLSEKLNNVILSSSCIRHTPPIYSSPELGEGAANTALNPPPNTLPVGGDSDVALSEPLCNNVVEDVDSNEQHLSSLTLEKEEIDHVKTKPEEMLVSDQTSYSGDLRELAEKTPKSPENLNISTQPAFSDFISQLKPEVLNSLAKIIKDVQKNTVKFYIHEEEESILCKEIKEYLAKLGNTECHPEQFLKRRADLDKLLIIIQNEDIANLIHKIPGLVTLKRLSCVSFAGVDSLDDVKNHTYNELFVSGGFVVSDESVLNPESITTDKLKQFLKFLEDLNTPDGKWQWKVHCKIQKKLKEQGRMNTNALSLLTLLNTYQKQHLVEILSYHNCDSQTRNAPELDCLIRLQAQNIQQRHIVFLTEKNLKTLSSYINNGIVVATVDDFMQNFKSLVGYHNSVTEENSLLPANAPTGQPVLVESDEKDEEDMSLDSGDETSQIEICSDASKYDTHLEALQTEAKGSHGADVKSCLSVTESPSEAQIGSMGKTSKIDLEEIQPITSVSTTCSAVGEKHSSVEQAPFSDFGVYSTQLNMPRQFSHFSVLTHQTFLGTTYPISSVSQNQEGGNYFVSAYSQSADTEKAASPGGWDVNCDSSRPYSNQK